MSASYQEIFAGLVQVRLQRRRFEEEARTPVIRDASEHARFSRRDRELERLERKCLNDLIMAADQEAAKL